LACATAARATTAEELLAGYSKAAGAAPSPERGQRFYNTNFGRDLGLSCASCHGAVPTKDGKDAVTEKRIAPFAPASNPTRFTDATKVEYNFRINCKDFVGRDCTAAEKADLLSWLLTQKP
jgi:hypothetical protein